MHLQVCQGILHGGGASERHHDCAAAPANEAARVLLSLPEALAVCHVVQAESGVQGQSGPGCEGCAFQLFLLGLLLRCLLGCVLGGLLDRLLVTGCLSQPTSRSQLLLQQQIRTATSADFHFCLYVLPVQSL